MDDQTVALAVGIGAPTITAGFGFLIALATAKPREARRDRRSSRHREEPETPAEGLEVPVPPHSELRPGAKFDEASTWYQVIQHFVDEAVEEATRPLLERLERSAERDRVFARFVQRIYWWDESGRRSDMPRLTYDEQLVLDLDLVPEDTRPRPPAPPAPDGPETY